MNYRFYDARILTMKEGEPVFTGEVWVRDERLVHVGEAMDLPGLMERKKILKWDEEIDCKGNILMPGFKNAHTHSAMTLLRSYADDLPLLDWLNQQVFPIEAMLTPEDIYWLTRLAVLEYLTSGVTAIFEMYLTPETIAKACRDSGMRCVQTGAVNQFSQTVEQLEEWYETINNQDPLNHFIPGFHAEYTCSEELLLRIAGLAKRLKTPIFTHVAETKEEVEGCMDRHGTTPGNYLISLGIFDYGGGFYHGVHLTKEEMNLMKNKGIGVITNPGSNTKLASGIAPIADFRKAGLTVAIGTDGPASNNCLDMFREMFLVTGLSKLREGDASAMDAAEVLKMATVNGSRMMGLNESDILGEGKLADLIMIDLHRPNMQPLNNLVKNIVYSGSKQNIAMTMIHGRILYRNGIFFQDTPEEEIYEKANNIMRRIQSEK